MTRRFLIAVLSAHFLSAAPAIADPQTAPQERLHVLYDRAAGEVVRRMVRVVAPHPELSLTFRWDPAPGNWPGVDAAGFAEGPGVVTWRIEGLADYDPRGVDHRYEGSLKAGRFEGPGQLTYRDGAERRGQWIAGRLEGEGYSRDAGGNVYEGGFAADRPDGTGTWRGRDGTVYAGGFVAGERHGPGRITEPGGLSYAVTHDMGQLVETARPDVPDALVGGLLPAQGGDSASNVRLALGVDLRTTENAAVQYASEAADGSVYIFPRDEGDQNLWNGRGWLSEFGYTLRRGTDAEWDETRAFLALEMGTRNGGRERLKSLDLVVRQAAPHLQPMLTADPHLGCVGFRPSFSILNYGWGPVESGTAQVRFIDPKGYDPNVPRGQEHGSGWFELPIPRIEQGADIYVRDVLAAAGVDVNRLETERFTCPSADLLDQCRATAKQSVNFGQLGPYVNGWDGLSTRMQAKMSYGWTDAFGKPQTSEQWFSVDIPLLKIETPAPLAECGDAGAYAPEAPQFQHVELNPDAGGYRVNIPVRGNPNIDRLIAGLALWSRKSAWHNLQVEASFADGSVRSTPPVHLFFLHPRQPAFTSSARPASCYLDPAGGSC